MDDDRRQEIEDEIDYLRARAKAISFLEKADLRYNNFVKQPNPMTKALMGLIMDVSGSMGEREKTIAKKFFILLYLFLRRKYKDIDVVFIRHHHIAEECDQETFFTKPETGGTMVSTAYAEMERVGDVSATTSPSGISIWRKPQTATIPTAITRLLRRA